MYIKFYLNRCRFAVAVTKCLGGLLFGDTVYSLPNMSGSDASFAKYSPYNYVVTLKLHGVRVFGVTQCHRKWHYSIDHMPLSIIVSEIYSHINIGRKSLYLACIRRPPPLELGYRSPLGFVGLFCSVLYHNPMNRVVTSAFIQVLEYNVNDTTLGD